MPDPDPIPKKLKELYVSYAYSASLESGFGYCVFDITEDTKINIQYIQFLMESIKQEYKLQTVIILTWNILER